MAAMRITVWTLFVCILALAGTGCGERSETLPSVPLDSNLVVNPSFEAWTGAAPTGWQVELFGGSGLQENRYGKSADFQKSGRFSFYLRGVFNADRWMVLVQKHPIIPGYRLSFSAEMRADGLERMKHQEDHANIYVRFYDRNGKRVSDRYYADAWTSRLHGTSDWKRYGKAVEIPKNARTVDIGCINAMNGYLYFDDVELKLGTPTPWIEKKMKHVNFYYIDGHPLPPGAMEAEDAFLGECLKKLHVKVKGKVTYYYYPSLQTFQEMFGVKRSTERLFAKKRELHTADPADRHEIVHLLLQPLGNPPYGVAEGAYLYCMGSWEGRNLHMLTKQYLIEKRLPALYMIMGVEKMDKLGMSISAPAWGSFCMWLVDRYGIKKFMRLYVKVDEVEEPGTFNSIFKGVYGEDFDVMDRNWRLWVLRYNPTV